MRIIFVPQYPTPMRYSEWWFKTLPGTFQEMGHQVVVLGREYANIMHTREDLGLFASVHRSIEFEIHQIREYMDIVIKQDDVLFLADTSFPGIFPNVLYHKKCPKMFAFCHATPLNNYDYYSDVSYSKYPVECSQSLLFDKIFLGSEYHQKKLQNSYSQNVFWKNTSVTYLPFPPIDPSTIKNKRYDLMSASRPTPQKVDLDLEIEVSKKFGQINRPISDTWSDYFDNLALSKILLITAHEDTFGYQIVDAVMNGCIPIARNSFAYPELLPRDYLYDSKEELLEKISYYLEHNDEIPTLLCEDKMKNFYKNIVKEMEE
ncbi:MAG: glycosyltransferase [Candidatus Thorarchaeota archaeon]